MNQNQLLPSSGFGTTDPAAIAAAEGAKARIQAAYSMALHKPRNVEQARINIIEECRRPAFAAKVEYSKPVGGRKIRGASIRLTETALQLFGNIDTETQVIFEDDQIRRIKVRCLCLESNVSFSKDVNIKKTVERKNPVDREIVGERINTQGEKVFVVKATEDELANKEAALVSKEIRNNGLRLIPQDIIDEAIETARETLKNQDAKDPNAAKKKILDTFAAIGIKPVELEKYLEHGLDTISPAELEDLRSVYAAIRDGESTWQDFIKPKEDPKPPAPKNIDPVTGEVFDPYQTRKPPIDIKTRPPARGEDDSATAGPDEEAAKLAEIATELFNELRGQRKLFGPNVRGRIEVILNHMTEFQRQEIKRKWRESAAKAVNGVKKDEPFPGDVAAANPEPTEEDPEDTPEDKGAASSSGDPDGIPSTSSESSGETGEPETNGQNGFTYCPKKDGAKVPEAVCEDCPDYQKCEDEKYFFAEIKVFNETLGPILVKHIIREKCGDSDHKKVPVGERQDVLIALNAALDDMNNQKSQDATRD